MPTYLVGPTRPYTTIQAAVNAVVADGQTYDIVVDPGTYNEAVTVPNISAAFIIRSADGYEAKGIFDSPNIVNISPLTGSSPITINRTGTIVKNIQFTKTIDSSALIIDSRANNLTYENCLLKTLFDCFAHIASNGGIKFYKCIAWGLHTTGTGTAFSNNAFVSVQYESCGVYGFRSSFHNPEASRPTTCINCWAVRNPNFTDFQANRFSGIGASGCSNNASSDTSAPGSNSITSLTFSEAAFTGATAGNFHISQHSRLYNAGTSRTSLFTTDFDLETITSWSIGPDAQAATNNCLTDVFNYTLSNTTEPWKRLFGNPSIDTTRQQIILSFDDAVQRTAYNNIDGWVATFNLGVIDTSDILFGPEYNASFTGNLPDVRRLPGGYTLTGARYGVYTYPGFGAWNNLSLPASGNLSATVTLFYKAGSGSLAARLTHQSINYNSGFVVLGSGITNAQLLRIITNNQAAGGSSTSERVNISSISYRLGLSDNQVDSIYNGAGVCSDLNTIVPTTSSSPWVNQNAPHEEVEDAESAKLKTKQGERSPSNVSRTSIRDAKPPRLNTTSGQASPELDSASSPPPSSFTPNNYPKGYKDGVISIMPETGGYSANSVTLGTGNRVHFYSDDLNVGKEFANCGCVTSSRSFKSRVDIGQNPSGGFVSVLKSNDCIPILQSHFQKRIGTTPSAGTTYYEFSPNRGQLLMTGSSFGTGSYNSSGTWSAFTLSAYKSVEGSAYHFKTGVCDRLGFSFDARGEALINPSMVFKNVELIATNTSLPKGSASTLNPFYGHQFSVDFLGLPVVKFDLESRNNIKSFRRVGTSGFNHQFGRYEVTGQATVDLAKVSLAHFGSMLGASSFAVVGTLYGDERNKMVFSMPRVMLKPYELNINNTTVNVPFACYESEDGGTAPLTIKLWTRNYSGTSFEPN